MIVSSYIAACNYARIQSDGSRREASSDRLSYRRQHLAARVDANYLVTRV